MSVNVAYKDVTVTVMKAEEIEGVYENPDNNIIIKSSDHDQSTDNETTTTAAASTYESICTGKQTTPEYTDTDGPL